MTDLFPGQTGNTARYRGDRVQQIMATREPFGPDICGPNNRGAYYTPVGADYDPATDLTTVQFRPIPRDPSGGRPTGLDDALLPPMTRQQRRQYQRIGRKAMKQKVKR